MVDGNNLKQFSISLMTKRNWWHFSIHSLVCLFVYVTPTLYNTSTRMNTKTCLVSSVGFTLIAIRFPRTGTTCTQYCYIAGCYLSSRILSFDRQLSALPVQLLPRSRQKLQLTVHPFYLRYSTTTVVMSHNIVVKPDRVSWQDQRQPPGELVSTGSDGCLPGSADKRRTPPRAEEQEEEV